MRWRRHVDGAGISWTEAMEHRLIAGVTDVDDFGGEAAKDEAIAYLKGKESSQGHAVVLVDSVNGAAAAKELAGTRNAALQLFLLLFLSVLHDSASRLDTEAGGEAVL